MPVTPHIECRGRQIRRDRLDRIELCDEDRKPAERNLIPRSRQESLGLAGMPMFAAFQAGQSTATLGYLVGFLASAALVSSLAGRQANLGFGRCLAISTVGTAVIFLFGVTWLALMLQDLGRAIAVGLVPFAAWSAVKIGLAASLVAAAPRRIR